MENTECSLKQLLTDLSFGIDEEKVQVNESHSEALASETEKSQEERLKTSTTAAFPEEVVKLIPDWIDFSGEEGHGKDENLVGERENSICCSASRNVLELLGTDVTANLFAYLTLTDIESASLVSRALYQACRSEELWKAKFLARWNADWVSSSSSSSWFQAYQAAYANTHDLWMTHWNIVLPEDGDSPGRCCIITDDANQKHKQQEETGERCCPSCRHTNISSMIGGRTINQSDVQQAEIEAAAYALAYKNDKVSKSKVIRASTRYSVAKWLYNASPSCTSATPMPTRSSSVRAFESAATFHRFIDTRQYETKSLHFMKDAVFLNACDSFLKHEMKEEIEQVQDEVYGRTVEDVTAPGGSDTVTHLGPYFELTQHTWHVVRFSNPDYVRPLTFRISVQRPDCFTVYPSEGYLDPGQSCYVFLGVRLLGGLMNQATEALNVQREEVDPFLADVYTHEAHLPYAPFCIRYMFCAVAPCIPPLFTSRGKTRPGVPPSQNKYKSVVSYLWEHVATEATVRTQYISAHVNSNYSYNEFCQGALQSFDIHTSTVWRQMSSENQPLVHIAPSLMYRFPAVFERQQDVQLEHELSERGKTYRTERECVSCGRDWGARAEELGRRFLLQMLISIAQERNRSLEMHNFVTALRTIHSVVGREDASQDWDEVYFVLFVLHGVLMKYRAMQRVSTQQRDALTIYEVIVDHLCQIVQLRRGFQGAALEDGPMTWRHVGIYGHRRCTDSVFEPTSFVGGLLVESSKEEPDYLEGFRHLCHNPGTYCLGQQQDPNHEDREIPVYDVRASALQGAFRPIQREKASDIFMDDTTLSFASALAMIHDPRSLIVHGVYDRVFAPGTISRRPSTSSPHFERAEEALRDTALVESKIQEVVASWNMAKLGQPARDAPLSGDNIVSRGIHVQYNDVDPDGFELTNFLTGGKVIQLLDDFVRNVPPPGMGRFAISELNESAERNDDEIVEFALSTDRSSGQNNNPANVAPLDPFEAANQQDRLNPLLVGPRGPRLFNLFWLLSSHLGWSIQENNGGSPVLVDRRILIASQWVANSAMVMPLLYTLMARSVEWISPKPIDYHLEGIPYELDNEMRFFSPRECAIAAYCIFALWLMLGRYSERKIGRTFERSMMEHLPSEADTNFVRRNFIHPASLWMQQLWDRLCPIFLQRRVFTPRWNRRTYAEITKHIRLWRSKDLREHRSNFPSSAGRGVMTFGASVEDGGPPVSIWEESTLRKFFTGALIALGSFSACSPHFSLNVLTVFCCSIGLGMSVSLQSMETGRGIPSSSSNPPGRSIFRPVGLNTVVIGFFLIGQLVGSSGGVLFLAEFVVTSVSLVLGGAGTISASAMESWGCFFVLSTTAFWGYVFARVALMDGMRHKRRSASGVFLCASLVALSLLWMLTLLVWRWDVPPAVMILRETLSKRPTRKQIEQQLQ